MPRIEMVVLQPTAFCNINCSYCYLPDRDNKHVLAQSTVTRLFTELFASGWARRELTVIWHAGEPLVAPVAFYREAFETIERMRPPSVIVKPCIPDQRHADRRRLVRAVPRLGASASASASTARATLHDANRKTRSRRGHVRQHDRRHPLPAERRSCRST